MKITLIGNIGKDAQLRKVHNGEREDSVLSVWVAENIKKRSGEVTPVWTKVTIWRGYAEAMAQYLTKGRKILVEGTGKPAFYTNKQNQVVPYLDVQASNIELLDGKKPENTPPEEESNPEEIAEDAMPW